MILRALAASLLVFGFVPGAGGGDATPAAVRVVASCDFEGPYSQGEQQIHAHCVNNWQWGRKDMLLKADRDAGRPGTVQRIQVRGITSGGMQFFYTKMKLKKNHFYKISYWLKSDGLEGALRAYVRKGGHPWTVYVYGDFEPRTSQWKEYAFTGRCDEDVNDDLGVCWETGSIGTVWLDDLKVEESRQPFTLGPRVKTPPEPAGNLLPRSSFEGRRDQLWCQAFFGWERNGVWEGVEGDWEDPQMHRAPGGKVGDYCMAVPNAVHAGQPSCHSTLVDLLPGKPYTVSVWIEHKKAGVDKFFVYQMHNTDSMMYFGGYQSLLIDHDRSPTPAAVATAVTAYCIDGLAPAPFKPIDGVVQGLFAGQRRATWAVYDDSSVFGRKRLDLGKLPRDVEVLDVMGNDSRRDGKREWEIGLQPLLVMSAKLAAAELAAATQGAVH